MDSNVAVLAAQISPVVCGTEKAHWPCFSDRKSMQLLLARMKYHNPARQTGKRGCKSWSLGVRQVHRVCQRVTESEICFPGATNTTSLCFELNRNVTAACSYVYVSVCTCTIHCVFWKKRGSFQCDDPRVKARTNGETPPEVSRQPWLNTIARQRTRRPKGREEYNAYDMLVSILDDCYNQGPLITYPD